MPLNNVSKISTNYHFFFTGMQQQMILSSGAGPPPHSANMKFQENAGADTFSDFVSLVCQEAQNSQGQVTFNK